MGRIFDVRETVANDEIVEILFGRENECLRDTGNLSLTVCDDLSDEKVEIDFDDIDNFIKALQAAKKEWT